MSTEIDPSSVVVVNPINQSDSIMIHADNSTNISRPNTDLSRYLPEFYRSFDNIVAKSVDLVQIAVNDLESNYKFNRLSEIYDTVEKSSCVRGVKLPAKIAHITKNYSRFKGTVRDYDILQKIIPYAVEVYDTFDGYDDEYLQELFGFYELNNCQITSIVKIDLDSPKFTGITADDELFDNLKRLIECRALVCAELKYFMIIFVARDGVFENWIIEDIDLDKLLVQIEYDEANPLKVNNPLMESINTPNIKIGTIRQDVVSKSGEDNFGITNAYQYKINDPNGYKINSYSNMYYPINNGYSRFIKNAIGDPTTPPINSPISQYNSSLYPISNGYLEKILIGDINDPDSLDINTPKLWKILNHKCDSHNIDNTTNLVDTYPDIHEIYNESFDESLGYDDYVEPEINSLEFVPINTPGKKINNFYYSDKVDEIITIDYTDNIYHESINTPNIPKINTKDIKIRNTPFYNVDTSVVFSIRDSYLFPITDELIVSDSSVITIIDEDISQPKINSLDTTGVTPTSFKINDLSSTLNPIENIVHVVYDEMKIIDTKTRAILRI